MTPSNRELGNDLSQVEMEDKDIAARRLHMYSDKTLEIGFTIDQMFVSHTEFKEGLAGLDRIFQLSTKVDMPHGLRLIGPPGAGKTTLLKYFQQSLPRSSLFAEGLGAVYMRIPMRVTTPYMIASLLRQYGYPFRRITWDTLEQRITVLLDAIRQKGTRLIMIDEAHNLAPSLARRKPTREEGTSPTDFVRLLIDEARVGVVFSGVSLLDDFAEVDEALASRVVGCHRLTMFNYDSAWLRLIKGFVLQSQKMDIQVFLDRDVGQRLYKTTQGNLRSLKRLMTEMVLVAAESGADSVRPEHLHAAYGLVYGAAFQKGNPFEAAVA
ncbi:MAG: hypothetical protein A2Z93_05180 [Curvibacter sp. GWA2_64_110]|nr:MAG: hypothetical protein A2Z93_05180 [Curvibacter sp. GWA2_64_110]HCY15704.1 hypothetical protein [Curvibacter sp.]